MIENQLLKQFKNQFRTHGRVFSAPGRIHLIGEQTDLFEGNLLSSVINQKFYVVIAKRDGLDPFPIVRIVSSKTNEISEFNLFSPPQNQWMLYFWGIMKEMGKRGAVFTSFDLFIHSDIPLGAGLASSASLCSAYAKALNTVFHLNFSLMELAEIGRDIEHNYLDAKSRFSDHFVTMFGIQNTFIKFDSGTFEYEYIPFEHSEFKLVLFNSRIKQNFPEKELMLRKSSYDKVISVLKKDNPDINSIKDVSLIDFMEYQEIIDPVDFVRFRFLIEENRRVLNLCEDLKNNDCSSLEYMLFASHEGLKDLFEVSCPELDFLVKTAQKTPGIIGSKMIGTGFGGCTINVVKANQYDQFIKVMCEKFEKKYLKTAIFYQI